MRIVRIANFVTPVSGGLRTALDELGAGYLAAGHEPVLIVPGPAARDEQTRTGRRITLPGPAVPGMGGYRVLIARRRLLHLPGRRLAGPLNRATAERFDTVIFALTNLAVCGACSADLAREQLPRALTLRPSVTTILIGVNDTLRGRFAPTAIARDLEQAIAGLTGAGSIVATATLPDPGLLPRVPDAFRRPPARRVP
ncbi:GDSL-type esterase/lipase family protein [Nonomuraea composti]|uniref:GDSL-type esterase/lipase family protein n=1 Tax=Nonomuraea composti TaxID=2720023 RepID=UPI0019800947|nr:GDSL-type esterase/lipase family protein [Nonomuraea sp. FMUSA5-5]